jgi:glycopeptide antibiotics resistance protein
MFFRHPFLSLATLGYLVLVGYITLGPQPVNADTDGIVSRLLILFGRYDATDWVTYSRLEFLANVAMFVPIGLFFLLLFGRRLWWLSILFGIALTCGIEYAQTFLPTRVPDVRDLVSNSAGATIGVLVGLVLTAGKARRIRRARARGTRTT